ncbi:Uncharacterised protein [Vibrio cholerae]|nr:Uncharacterised protein [Vibrio cholerae]
MFVINQVRKCQKSWSLNLYSGHHSLFSGWHLLCCST